MKYFTLKNHRFHYWYVRLSIIMLFFSNQIIGQNGASEKSDAYNKFFSYCYENEIFNGAVAVIDKGELIFKNSYGFETLKGEKKIDGDTQFLLASLSKQFTAIGIVLLKTQGKLKYSDPVNQYLSDFPYEKITIKQLLNQTSGIPEYTKLINSQRDYFLKKHRETGFVLKNKELAMLFSKNKPALDFEPGTNFKYSNTNYVYLALLIEKISNTSFSKFMSENIFNPLQMNHSVVYEGDKTQFKKRASGYKFDIKKGKQVPHDTPLFFNVYGDGGIYSSLNDLIKWDKALRDNNFIHQNELQEVYNTPEIRGKKAPYGFGWFVRSLPFNGQQAVTHSGKFVGFTNSFFRLINEHQTTIVLSNNFHQINGEINSALIRILYNKPYNLPKISAAKKIAKIIRQDGIEKASAFFIEHNENTDYNFSERELNRLGYDLIAIDMLPEAIQVFKWNVQKHANSANVYDSLGEAYLKLGNTIEALKNYEIAFKKDPENQNVKQIIEKLRSNEN